MKSKLSRGLWRLGGREDYKACQLCRCGSPIWLHYSVPIINHRRHHSETFEGLKAKDSDAARRRTRRDPCWPGMRLQHDTRWGYPFPERTDKVDEVDLDGNSGELRGSREEVGC